MKETRIIPEEATISECGKNMNYEIVIGLEIHAVLSTKTKLFCSCSTEFGKEPNTHCCPVCTGMPGALPVLNRKAVELAVKAGLAANCSIAAYSWLERKHYFYPDLPKAYQISQYKLPICSNGHLIIEPGGKTRKVGIIRIQLEEDAGKLIHKENGDFTLIDYNRCGIPLIEIVTGPDLRSSEEVKAFFEKMKLLLQYTGVSDCKMQEGHLRADINLSVRPLGQEEPGVKTEIKNLNSLSSIVKAVESEAERQISIIESGGIVEREARQWNEEKSTSFPMRNKEDVYDYRYSPESDLCPVVVDKKWLEKIKASIPELPDERKKRYIEKYGLPDYDAAILTSSRHLSDFFDETVAAYGNAKAISNWIMVDVMKRINSGNPDSSCIKLRPVFLAKLIKLTDDNVISTRMAKQIFDIMWDTGMDPADIIRKYDFTMITDRSVIRGLVSDVIKENPGSVTDFKKGKLKAKDFLIGQVMRMSSGKAHPGIVNSVLDDELAKYLN